MDGAPSTSTSTLVAVAVTAAAGAALALSAAAVWNRAMRMETRAGISMRRAKDEDGEAAIVASASARDGRGGCSGKSFVLFDDWSVAVCDARQPLSPSTVESVAARRCPMAVPRMPPSCGPPRIGRARSGAPADACALVVWSGSRSRQRHEMLLALTFVHRPSASASGGGQIGVLAQRTDAISDAGQWTVLSVAGSCPVAHRSSIAACIIETRASDGSVFERVLVAYVGEDHLVHFKLLCPALQRWIDCINAGGVDWPAAAAASMLPPGAADFSINMCSSGPNSFVLVLASPRAHGDVSAGVSGASHGVWLVETDTKYTQSQEGILPGGSRGAPVLSCSRLLRRTMSREGSDMDVPSPALVMTGPSGVGKGSLLDLLTREFSESVGFSVSHTSRKPRPGEEDGVHYHFRDKQEILDMVEKGDFIESAHVHGNVYGTSKQAVMEVVERGKVCLLDIDVQGARAVRCSSIPCVLVFIMPPSMAVLEKRLRGRGTETENVITSRLSNAREEIRSALDRTQALFNVILVNDDLHETYSLLKSLIARLLPEQDDQGAQHVPLTIPAVMGAVTLANVDGQVVLMGSGGSFRGATIPDAPAYRLNLDGLKGSAPGYTTGASWEDFRVGKGT